MASTQSHAVRTTIIVIVVLVILIGIGLILYFFVFKKKVVTPPITPSYIPPIPLSSITPSPSSTPPSSTPPSSTPPTVTPPTIAPSLPVKYCPVGDCEGPCNTDPNIPTFCKTSPGAVFESNGQWYITIPNTTDTSKCLPLFAVTPVKDNSVTCILDRGQATPCFSDSTNPNGGCYIYLQD